MTSREERRARRVLRQMDRAAGGRGGAAGRGAGAGATLGVLVTVGALALSGFLVGGGTWDPTEWFAQRAYVEIDGRPVAIPRPEPAEGRLRAPVPAETVGEHAFLHTDDAGNPIGYDPCRPVRFVVRPDGMPASGRALIDEAVQVVAEAAGLVLEDVGDTDEMPAVERRLIQPERYGEGWAPVLIAWADETEMPELAGEVAGVGGSAAVPGANGRGQWLAAGRVVLDRDDIAGMLARSGGHAQARAIVVHELAHVLGLDHVGDPDELMHPVSSTRTDLGPGDRQGLALLGQVACED